MRVFLFFTILFWRILRIRIDHITYRVPNRIEAADFFVDVFSYDVVKEFAIKLPNRTFAKCIVLSPPEKSSINGKLSSYIRVLKASPESIFSEGEIEDEKYVEYHIPPDIFVIDGDENSEINNWVKKRSNLGGIHHMAFQVKNLKKIINLIEEKKHVEISYTSFLKFNRIFTKPNKVTGLIYEFIEWD